MRRLIAGLLACLAGIPATAVAQPKRETPVGMVLAPQGATIIPAGSETALAAKAAEILFAGDVLRSGASAVTFLFCPGKTIQTLAPSGEIQLQANAIKVRSGKAAEVRKSESCFLPSVLHVATASQQHYGVSMVRALNKGDDTKPAPRDKFDAATRAELAPLEAALAQDPKDPVARLARAAVFEKHNLAANALEEYRNLSAEFADAVWIKGKIFELQEAIALASAATPAAEGGKTYAVLIGISQYQKLPKETWLQYADADAKTFHEFLQSPRGGALQSANVVLLANEKATTAAIRNAFQTFLKAQAGKSDSVIILMAAHGTVETPGSKGAFVVTYDTDPQDLTSTALPMAEVQDLVQTGLSRVGRVTLLADICRAGTIGSIRSTTVNSAVERLGEAEGEILGLMASRPKELSHEGPQYGGGHGAFSYYLLKGLNGAADKNNDGIVDVNEAIEYVRREVAEGTADKQHPRDFGTASSTAPLSDIRKAGIPLARLAPAHWPDLFASGAPPLQTGTARNVERFSEALNTGRILPDAPDNAFEALEPLARELPPVEFLARQNQLRVALENRGQQILLRYLEGDEVPQQRSDFADGDRYFAAALRLTPESLYLQARRLFCQGRVAIFDKRYAEAADLLEQSIRFDPNAAYAYNALGIAYLEQAEYPRSLPAFRDAIRRAPQWTYPLHNLALASIETGDYRAAERNFDSALRLTPGFAYLHYNRGVLYQRLNRRKDAEIEYRTALEQKPELADAYNALGSLAVAQRKNDRAEQSFREALKRAPQLLAARQNLALLLFSQRDRQAEALASWRENLSRDADYLPSRLSLAEALAKSGKPADAASEYREVLRRKPAYVAARLALSDLMQRSNEMDGALEQLAEAAKLAPQNAEVQEEIGDVQSARGHRDEAAAAYRAALASAADGAARKRLRSKLGGGK